MVIAQRCINCITKFISFLIVFVCRVGAQIKMVGPAGLEPATPRFEVSYSIQLSYGPASAVFVAILITAAHAINTAIHWYCHMP